MVGILQEGSVSGWGGLMNLCHLFPSRKDGRNLAKQPPAMPVPSVHRAGGEGGVDWQPPSFEQHLIPVLPGPPGNLGRCCLLSSFLTRGSHLGAKQHLLLMPATHYLCQLGWWQLRSEACVLGNHLGFLYG